MAALLDSHTFVIQSFMARPVLDEAAASKLFDIVLQGLERSEDDDVEAMRMSVVEHLNEELNPLGLELRRAFNEVDGRAYFGLVNSVPDEFSKLGTALKDSELQFFAKVIDAVVTSDEGAVPWVTAVNCANGLGGLTKKDANGVLQRLIAEQWLQRLVQPTRLQLGVRSLLELPAYLKTVFEEPAAGNGPDVLHECTVCQELVIAGQTCSNARCSCKMHRRCARVWYERHDNWLCPTCHHGQWQLTAEDRRHVEQVRQVRRNRAANAVVVDY